MREYERTLEEKIDDLSEDVKICEILLAKMIEEKNILQFHEAVNYNSEWLKSELERRY